MQINSLTPQEFQQRLSSDEAFDLVDVRSPGEFARVHATMARNVPLNQFDAAALLAQRGEGAPALALICHSGSRAATAAQSMAAAGCQGLYLIDGGTQAWQRAGLPVQRGKGSISLDRQMQITVGLLIITGVILGYSVSEWWYLLSAAIGLGLLNAGLTGICPLAMVLAVMPWNGRVTVGGCATPGPVGNADSTDSVPTSCQIKSCTLPQAAKQPPVPGPH